MSSHTQYPSCTRIYTIPYIHAYSCSQFLFMVVFTTFLVTCLRFHVLWVDTVPFEKNNQTGQRDVIFSDLFDLSGFDRWGWLRCECVKEHTSSSSYPPPTHTHSCTPHTHTHTHTHTESTPLLYSFSSWHLCSGSIACSELPLDFTGLKFTLNAYMYVG